MSISSAILKLDNLFTSTTVERTVKAVVAVVAAQGALYTTVVPSAPSLATSGAVAGGSGVLVAIISLVITWANKSQTKQLAALGVAIDQAVTKRLTDRALQAASQPPSTTAA